MKPKDIKFNLLMTLFAIDWIILHVVGIWDYNFSSMLFPVLWFLIVLWSNNEI